MTEPINDHARRHEETVQTWTHGDASRVLYRFFDLINARFFDSKVPTPVLSFKHTRSLGHYVRGRNEIGVRENVNIDAGHLGDPTCDVIETLAHEMVPSWQENCGKPGRGNYHNVECLRKMQEIGIPCTRWGRSLGMRDPFVTFLREHGVEAMARLEVSEPFAAVRRTSRLKKWRCDCTSVWSTAQVHAVCTDCRKRFVGC